LFSQSFKFKITVGLSQTRLTNHLTMPDSTSKQAESKSWTTQKRCWVSLLLVLYLIVVISGPMTNPIATEELTGPIGRTLQPVHQSLFLGHGYRFFAPNPGPSHLVVFKIYDGADLKREGVFPDVARHWPRVIYHRWFMLSETLFEEMNRTPNQASFDETQNYLNKQIERFEGAGQGGMARPLIARRDRLAKLYPLSIRRIDDLKYSVAQKLLETFGGNRIELFVQERGLPSPADVALGQKLSDKNSLSQLYLIGEYKRDDALPPSPAGSE
jgi:hypothetical protein